MSLHLLKVKQIIHALVRILLCNKQTKQKNAKKQNYFFYYYDDCHYHCYYYIVLNANAISQTCYLRYSFIDR